MTEEHRRHQLAIAADHLVAARVRWDEADTKKARRAAAENIEFWGNKVAFLTAIASETVR